MCESFSRFEFEKGNVAPNIDSKDTKALDQISQKLKTTSLLCLRLAMKYEENQERLFEASIVRNFEKVLIEDENELVSPHQHILDLITESLILNVNQITLPLTVGPTEKQDKPLEIIEQEVDKQIQALEHEILISIDW